MSPRDPRREMDTPARIRESSSKFEEQETPSYNRSPIEFAEHFRELGRRMGESEVAKLRDQFVQHCEKDQAWQREVDRKLDRACDGIDVIKQDNIKNRDKFEKEQQELSEVVKQHEQYVQQAKGAAFATRLLWLLIGALISALIWVFTHIGTPTPKASEQTPYRYSYDSIMAVPAASAATPSPAHSTR